MPQALRALLGLGALGIPPAVPVEEARRSGRRHSRTRDRAATGHHYDLGNDFYTSILDETMAYSCGDRLLDYRDAPAERCASMRAAPAMTMRPPHREARDVTSVREHCVLTVNTWARRLDDVWHEVAHRYGARRARIWRLHLAGVARAFERNRMIVHQVLAVRSHAGGASDMPRPRWFAPEGAGA